MVMFMQIGLSLMVSLMFMLMVYTGYALCREPLHKTLFYAWWVPVSVVAMAALTGMVCSISVFGAIASPASVFVSLVGTVLALGAVWVGAHICEPWFVEGIAGDKGV